jgi:hypothetical protein
MTANWHTITLDVLAAVPPRSLYAYLDAQEWKRVRPYGDMGDAFALEGQGREVLVPASADFTDYPIRVNEVIVTLSQVEERDRRAVLRDLLLADVDLVRIRIPGGTGDGSMPVDSGVALFQEARNLLLAAACSATRPQKAFRLGGNNTANDYIKTVRFGQTEQGSFVVSLLSPVPLNLDRQNSLFNNLPNISNDPFERKVTRKLVSGLRATREAVTLANRAYGINPFEERVAQGVSANLCEAVGNLINTGDGQGVDISVSWALTRTPHEGNALVHFGNSDAPVLKEASRVLKERQERSNERIEGYVTVLRRSEAEPQGRARIKAAIEGVMSSVRIDFAPADYSRIVDAHDRRQVVSLEGDLRRDGQRWVLGNPRDLVVLADDD